MRIHEGTTRPTTTNHFLVHFRSVLSLFSEFSLLLLLLLLSSLCRDDHGEIVPRPQPVLSGVTWCVHHVHCHHLAMCPSSSTFVVSLVFAVCWCFCSTLPTQPVLAIYIFILLRNHTTQCAYVAVCCRLLLSVVVVECRQCCLLSSNGHSQPTLSDQLHNAILPHDKMRRALITEMNRCNEPGQT